LSPPPGTTSKILNCYQEGGAGWGADADLVAGTPTKTITVDGQQSAIGYNVFEGKEVKGLPQLADLWRGGL
jgi:dihydropyrimidinase